MNSNISLNDKETMRIVFPVGQEIRLIKIFMPFKGYVSLIKNKESIYSDKYINHVYTIRFESKFKSWLRKKAIKYFGF